MSYPQKSIYKLNVYRSYALCHLTEGHIVGEWQEGSEERSRVRGASERATAAAAAAAPPQFRRLLPSSSMCD